MADRICVMNKGAIVEAGKTAQIFEAPKQPYTKHLLDSEPKGSPAKPGADAPVVLEARDMKVWFAIRGGLFRRVVDHVKARRRWRKWFGQIDARQRHPPSCRFQWLDPLSGP
jgi:microcin C transport system ATP-binding protein